MAQTYVTAARETPAYLECNLRLSGKGSCSVDIRTR